MQFTTRGTFDTIFHILMYFDEGKEYLAKSGFLPTLSL